MSWSHWNELIRQIHRWVSMIFTVAVILNFVVMGLGLKEYPPWLGFLTLVPLALLQLTGLYLFVLPYATRWRSRREIGAGRAKS
jgi:hypothetical protein